MHKLNTFLMILLLTVLVGCSDEKPNNPNNPNNSGSNMLDWDFLKIKHSWTYEVYDNGKLTHYYTDSIVGKEIVESGIFYDVEVDGDLISTYFMDDIKWGFSPTAPISFKNNYVGRKDTVYPTFNNTTSIFEVLSISETVTVPAGKFDNCISIKVSIISDGEIIRNDYNYVSKKFGLIMYNQGDSLIFKLKSKNFWNEKYS